MLVSKPKKKTVKGSVGSQTLNPKQQMLESKSETLQNDVGKQTLKRMSVEIPSGLSVATGARKSEAACRFATESASRQASTCRRTDSGHVRRSEDCKGQKRMLPGEPDSGFGGDASRQVCTSVGGKPRTVRVQRLAISMQI